MKKVFYIMLTSAAVLFSASTNAQTTENKDVKVETKKEAEKQASETKTDGVKEAGKNIEKAAESIQRSAEKIKVVVEDKANKLAKTSQPAIESFLVASSGLIEKIAAELEKMVNEKSSKKSSQ